jgi:transposase InsO family protein
VKACWGLLISMKAGEELSLEQMQAFLEGSEEVRFEAEGQAGLYEWVSRTLRGQGYDRLPRKGKGLVKRYVAKMTGLSRAQVTRLISQYGETGEVKLKRQRRRRFAQRYTRADIELLARVDEAHETLSGPATVKILYREYYEFADLRYERLSSISVAHIYNLRKGRVYRERRIHIEKTRPTKISIGERRRPQPNGKPGYIRIDTVHQGDLDGIKGVYHINAVDEVTQWQVIGATPQISEAWLIPVLERILEQFPFEILGFHSDNGSEFINHTVSDLLNKLLIEQTKSRPRRSNDNGLVETKNGAVIRKHMGFGYIGSEHADKINVFYEEQFIPYLNFHRPCGVPELKSNNKGKIRRVYKWYATPWEILRQLPGMGGFLKDDLTAEILDGIAGAQSDTQAAMAMQEAKRKLFDSIWGRKIA